MGFFLSLVIVLGIQFLLELLLYEYLNLSLVIVNIIVDLVLSIIFTVLNFRGREKLRNPEFHKMLAIYFVILTAFTILFYYL